MLDLILTVVFGFAIAYFAIQNTAGVTVRFVNSTFGVPLYVVIVGSLLVGLLMAWLVSIANGIGSLLTIHGKDNELKASNKTVDRLAERVRELELENAGLRGEKHVPNVVEHVEEEPRRAPLIERFKARFA